MQSLIMATLIFEWDITFSLRDLILYYDSSHEKEKLAEIHLHIDFGGLSQLFLQPK